MKKYFLFVLMFLFLLLFFINKNTTDDIGNDDGINSYNIVGIKQPYPFLTNEKAIYNDLKNYSNSSIKAKYIFDNLDKLSITHKKMLANNKDTTDYIYGYLTGSRVPYNQGESVLLNRSYPYYIQWDRRWAYRELGSTNIAIGGCGPTVIAMALGGELQDKSITPDVISKIENEAGYFTEFGTSWSFFKYIANYYGMNYEEININKNNIDQVLFDNNSIIASVKPGRFTTVGHIILIVAMDENGNYIINDPNSLERTLKVWTYSELENELKALWSIN